MNTQTPKSKPTLAPDEYFAGLPPEKHAIAQALRALLLGAAPEIAEETKFGIPFYVYKGWVCFINVAKNRVELGFCHGVELSDVFGLFDPRGLKQVRHIVIPSSAFVAERAADIESYVLEAVARNDAKHAQKRRPAERRGRTRAIGT